MIEVNRVTKRFGSLVAVDDVSFTVRHGEVLGLLGPNGAGKTTLFKLMAGFLRPDGGEIRAGGPEWPSIGFKPEHLLYPNAMRVDRYLDLVARLANVDPATIPGAVAEALERVGLAGAAGKRIGACSKGMRQRLGLAQVLMGRPALLLIDEPSNGLDPAGQADIHRLILDLQAAGHTIVLSSHQLAEVTRLCTRLIILKQGRVHYENSVAEALAVRPAVTIQATQDLGALQPQLAALHPGLQVNGAVVRLEAGSVDVRHRVLRAILDAGLDVCRVEQQRATLDEIYAEVVR